MMSRLLLLLALPAFAVGCGALEKKNSKKSAQTQMIEIDQQAAWDHEETVELVELLKLQGEAYNLNLNSTDTSYRNYLACRQRAEPDPTVQKLADCRLISYALHLSSVNTTIDALKANQENKLKMMLDANLALANAEDPLRKDLEKVRGTYAECLENSRKSSSIAETSKSLKVCEKTMDLEVSRLKTAISMMDVDILETWPTSTEVVAP